jgi:hypothetical protein
VKTLSGEQVIIGQSQKNAKVSQDNVSSL